MFRLELTLLSEPENAATPLPKPPAVQLAAYDGNIRVNKSGKVNDNAKCQYLCHFSLT
jgi:hypothetical protein